MQLKLHLFYNHNCFCQICCCFMTTGGGSSKPSQESLDIADTLTRADDDGADDDDDDGDDDDVEEDVFNADKDLGTKQKEPKVKKKKNRTWKSLWVSEDVSEDNSLTDENKERTWDSLWK